MARASRSPKRYSLPSQLKEPRSDHREWSQFSLDNQQEATNMTYLHLQQRYAQQNKFLAQTVSKLQAQIGHLELELMNAERQIRSLKLKNTDLSNTVKNKISLFESEMTSRISELLACIDPGYTGKFVRTTPVFREKTNETVSKSMVSTKNDYLKEFTNNRRRKSALFMNNTSDMKKVSRVPEVENTEVTKDLSYVEEVNEPESEPAYEDIESALIPIKRQRESQLFAKEQIKSKPKVTLNEKVIPNLGTHSEFQVKAHTPNEAAELLKQEEDNNNTASSSILEEVLNTSNESIEELVSSPVKRKKRVPRELKNLDTEKTKKWLGHDPMEEELPRSRRSSIALRYDLPLRDKVYKKRKMEIFNDEENDEKVNGNSNGKVNVLTEKDVNVNDHASKEKSIFDLEQQDFLNIAIPIVSDEKGKKTRGRRRKRREDFVL